MDNYVGKRKLKGVGSENDHPPDEFVAAFKRSLIWILRFIWDMVFHTVGQIALVALILVLAFGYSSESVPIRMTAVLAVGLMCVLVIVLTGWSLIRHRNRRSIAPCTYCWHSSASSPAWVHCSHWGLA